MPKPENILAHKFPKGVSGNPKGRPKLPDLKKVLASVLGDEKEQKTALEAIMMAMRKKALNGDVRAAQFLVDRGYGMAKQDISLTGTIIRIKGEKPSENDNKIPEVE